MLAPIVLGVLLSRAQLDAHSAQLRIQSDQRRIAVALQTLHDAQREDARDTSWPFVAPLHRWRDEADARRAIALALADETRALADLASRHRAAHPRRP